MSNIKIPASLPEAEKACWYADEVFSQNGQVIRAFTHKNYSIDMHSHDFIELNIVLKGQGMHYMMDSSFPVTKGFVFAIPPGVKHGYLSTDSLDVFHILIHNQFIKQYKLQLLELSGYLMLFTVEPYFRTSNDFRYILQLPDEDEFCFTILNRMQQLTREASSKKELDYLNLSLIAYFCGLYEQQLNNDMNGLAEHLHLHAINTVIQYMNANHNRKVTLQELAGKANLQREYFCRIFHDVTGMSPMEYLNTIRLSKAREMILQSPKTLTEIALDNGFYDAAHFSRSFKAFYGFAPSVLRQ